MTTAAASAPEAWLRGPLPGIGPGLMPAAHALVQAREDLTRAASNATTEELWTQPGGAASAGFHLRHLAGSLDRLLAYARGERLTTAQVAAISAEGRPGAASAEHVSRHTGQLITTLKVVRGLRAGSGA